jgi:hypothetical protein
MNWIDGRATSAELSAVAEEATAWAAASVERAACRAAAWAVEKAVWVAVSAAGGTVAGAVANAAAWAEMEGAADAEEAKTLSFRESAEIVRRHITIEEVLEGVIALNT